MERMQSDAHHQHATPAGRFINSLIVFWLLFVASCSPPQENLGPKFGTAPAQTTTPTYIFAVHPLYNPTKLFSSYQALVDYLNRHLENTQIALEASRDYSAFEEKYKNGEPDIILPNPWQTLQAMEYGYEVIAMAGEPSDFKGIFIVRKDSSISQPADLMGKSVSYPAATALAACIMPQYFLFQNGIDVNHDIQNLYVGSQESSIMNVYLKQAAAGATWPPPWRMFQREHPQEASELKLIWETESLVNNSIMVRKDLPLELREQIKTLLLTLHETKEGREILANMDTARFLDADDKDYEIVREYVTRFEQEVRPIEEK